MRAPVIAGDEPRKWWKEVSTDYNLSCSLPCEDRLTRWKLMTGNRLPGQQSVFRCFYVT